VRQSNALGPPSLPPCPACSLQALAELCSGERPKYARLLAALVAVDMNKAFGEL